MQMLIIVFGSWDRMPFLTDTAAIPDPTRAGGGGASEDGSAPPNKASFDPVPSAIRSNLIVANYGGSQGVDNDDGSSWYDGRW